MQTEAAETPHQIEFYAATKKWSGWMRAGKIYDCRHEAQAVADLDVAKERAAGLSPLVRRPVPAKQSA